MAIVPSPEDMWNPTQWSKANSFDRIAQKLDKSNNKTVDTGFGPLVFGNGSSDVSSGDYSTAAIMQMVDKLVGQANQATTAQNQLQLQMAREANAMTAHQAELTRQFNAAEAVKAFERSEQSRLSTQHYNTAERIAAQEYSTAERIAAQNYNSAEAQKQMDFQERMSNTQYQRAVADLYAAGLNPLLAVGASAGNLSGSSGSVSGARSSGSSSSPTRSSAASSSSTSYHSAQAYRTNVESLINGVLSYAAAMKQADLQSEKNVFGFIGQLVSAIF